MRAAIVGFSVLASLLLVIAIMLVIQPVREDWLLYLLPAIAVPLVVSPLASHLILELAFDLDAANRYAKQQEQQLALLFEHAPIGIARLDHQGVVHAANPLMRAMLGSQAHEDVPAWSRVFAQPEALADFLGALRSARRLDEVCWQWLDPQQNERTVRIALVPMPATAAGATGIGTDAVLLAEDITERAAIEAQSLRAQKMELVGRLAGGVAHDFNNLLTVVRGSVAILGGPSASPELAAIDEAAASGARLTRRLLSISRHDLLTLTPQAAGPLVAETLELMRRVLPARIRIHPPAVVPDVILDLDRDAVQQAMLNLAVNARDAIQQEGTVRVEVCETEQDGVPMLVIAVVDDGLGMTESVRARAVEPFFSTKPADAGSGLGLAMVHGTLRRHGGCLTLTSTPGAGTRAELWFPVATERIATPSVVSPVPTPEGRPVSTSGLTDRGSRINGAPAGRLLLVEDEPAVRLATERALRRLGYEVTSTPDMPTALATIEAGAVIDLIVTDVAMPGGTGVDLLHAVRAAGHPTPVLLVSGYAVENLDALQEADPRVGVLSKPWTSESLGAKVNSLLPRVVVAPAPASGWPLSGGLERL